MASTAKAHFFFNFLCIFSLESAYNKNSHYYYGCQKGSSLTKDFLSTDSHDPSTPQSSSRTSLGKDFFIIAVGVVLILLTFLLFSTISGLGLKAEFPRVTTPVIDDYGNPIDVPEADIDQSVTRGFLRIGILTGLVAIVVFLTTLVILRWSKKFSIQMTPHQDKGRSQDKISLP